MLPTKDLSAGAGRTGFDIGDIFSRYGARCRRAYARSMEQARAMGAISKCRTGQLGGHTYVCTHCSYTDASYSSFRNRNCPKCQASAQYKWIAAQEKRLLNTHYFHVVFTLPAELRPLAVRWPKVVHALLMRSAADSLLTMGLDPRRMGGLVGVTAVLHTWSRTLAYHPHVHCIVTGRGLSPVDGSWRRARQDRLFPIRPLRALFRGKLMAGLRAAARAGRLELGRNGSALVHTLYRTNWHVYVKAPFAGAPQVFRYLGMYTHRVGLANSRLRAVNDDGIELTTRGEHTVRLPPTEFIRRFFLHVLPKGFVRIRHSGLLASMHTKIKLAQAAACLEAIPTKPAAEPDEEPSPGQGEVHQAIEGTLHVVADLFRCPNCDVGTLILLAARGPDPP